MPTLSSDTLKAESSAERAVAEGGPPSEMSAAEVVIDVMQAADMAACAQLVFNAFDYVMQHFIADKDTCTVDVRQKYRLAYLQYEAAKGPATQCRVARKGGVVIGFALWLQPSPNNDSDPNSSTQQPVKPDPPAGLNGDRWRNFVAIENEYARKALGQADRKELMFLAVRPGFQGLQVGKRLLHDFLQDYPTLPSYLVSTQVAVGFYEKLGFKVTEEASKDGGIKLSDDPSNADVIWPMVRR